MESAADRVGAHEKAGSFEWVVGWSEELAHLLAPASLGLDHASRMCAVDIGCGTSEFALRLAQVGAASAPAQDGDVA